MGRAKGGEDLSAVDSGDGENLVHPRHVRVPAVVLDEPCRSKLRHERAHRLARMGAWADPDAQIPGVDPSRSLDNKRLGDQALHLASDDLGVRIRDIERELDLLVVLLARGLDELQLVCAVGRYSCPRGRERRRKPYGCASPLSSGAIFSALSLSRAGVAELVDAAGLGPVGSRGP